ncbi:TlpA family protein disulfide reductase [Gemmatimonadota bacterium]
MKTFLGSGSDTSRRTRRGGFEHAVAGSIPALAVALFCACLLPPQLSAQDSGVGLPSGTPAPAAQLEDLEGNPVQMLDYVEAGKPTLIEIWASWCENCEALEPQLGQILLQFGDMVNVVSVAVAVAQSQRRVRRHVEEHGPGYPFLWDGGGEVVRAYNAATTSIVILLDEDGKVAYSGVGGGQNLLAEVEKLVGG